jgi:hypothetical protein
MIVGAIVVAMGVSGFLILSANQLLSGASAALQNYITTNYDMLREELLYY